MAVVQNDAKMGRCGCKSPRCASGSERSTSASGPFLHRI